MSLYKVGNQKPEVGISSSRISVIALDLSTLEFKEPFL